MLDKILVKEGYLPGTAESLETYYKKVKGALVFDKTQDQLVIIRFA